MTPVMDGWGRQHPREYSCCVPNSENSVVAATSKKGTLVRAAAIQFRIS